MANTQQQQLQNPQSQQQPLRQPGPFLGAAAQRHPPAAPSAAHAAAAAASHGGAGAAHYDNAGNVGAAPMLDDGDLLDMVVQGFLHNPDMMEDPAIYQRIMQLQVRVTCQHTLAHVVHVMRYMYMYLQYI